MFPPIKTPLFFFNRSTASLTPPLLKPILLIIAESSFSLNNRFFGFPSCPTGVRVPISIKPKPKFDNSSYNLASLSKPAANPTGFLNLSPKTSVSNRLSSTKYKDLEIDAKPGILESERINEKVK